MTTSTSDRGHTQDINSLVAQRDALLQTVLNAADEYANLSARCAELESVLKPIIDCYGVGYRPDQLEMFVKHLGPLIEEARAILNPREGV